MFRTLSIAVVVLGVASVASAQDSGSRFVVRSSAETTPGVFSSHLFDAGQSTTLQVASGPAHRITGRIHAGIYHAAGMTGFAVGGGAGVRPFSQPSLEVAGDLSLIRNGGINGFYLSGNVLYNIALSQSKATPFVGGGIGFLHGTGNAARPQILAGVEVPMRDKMAFRGDVRFVFTSGNITTFLLGGISF